MAQETWYDLRDSRVFVNRPPKNFKEWESGINVVAAMRKNNPCWIGDMLNLGQDTFGEKYTQVLDAFGYHNEQVINNYKSVMKRVPATVRRTNLFMGHYRHVTGYDSKDQKRVLAWCDKLGLNTLEFKRGINLVKDGFVSLDELVALDRNGLDAQLDQRNESEDIPDQYGAALKGTIDNLDKAIEFCDDKSGRDLLMTAKDAVLDAQVIYEKVLV